MSKFKKRDLVRVRYGTKGGFQIAEYRGRKPGLVLVRKWEHKARCFAAERPIPARDLLGKAPRDDERVIAIREQRKRERAERARLIQEIDSTP